MEQLDRIETTVTTLYDRMFVDKDCLTSRITILETIYTKKNTNITNWVSIIAVAVAVLSLLVSVNSDSPTLSKKNIIKPITHVIK